MLCSLNPTTPFTKKHLAPFLLPIILPSAHLALVDTNIAIPARAASPHHPKTTDTAQSTVGSDQLPPPIDPEIRASVDKLESDIIKTIANNDRLKEAQLEIEKLGQGQQWSEPDGLDEEQIDEDDDDEIVAVDEAQPDIQVKPSSEKVSILHYSSSSSNAISDQSSTRLMCAFLVWFIKRMMHLLVFYCVVCRVFLLNTMNPSSPHI